MPIPVTCRAVEAKFQAEVKTFPNLPDTIQSKVGHNDWPTTKEYIMLVTRDDLHKVHVDRIDHPDWARPNNMFTELFSEILQHLRDNTTYKQDNPFREVVRDYAKRVQSAHDEVIKCIRNPPAAAPLATKKVKRSDCGWDDPITAQRIKTADKVIRLDGKDTMIFLADDPDGLSKWLANSGKNPLTNLPTTSIDEFIIDIEEDAGPAPAEGGRRRKTKKSSRRMRKTRRSRK
jgi:hypothetical protein